MCCGSLAERSLASTPALIGSGAARATFPQKKMRKQAEKATMIFMKQYLSRPFNQWYAAAQDQKMFSKKVAKASMMLFQRTATTAFYTWVEEAEEARAEKGKLRKVTGAPECHCLTSQ